MTWTPALHDMRATLRDVVDLDRLLSCPDFAHVDEDTVFALLEQAGRWCQEVVAPTNRDGDTIGSNLVGDGVKVPESFNAAYQQYLQNGYGAIQHPTELGGGGFPLTVSNAFKEMLTAANMAFSLGPLLTTGAVEMLNEHGSEQIRQTYGTKLVSGEWTGTMCLTEPQAGSDVGAVATKAEPQDDGSWRIRGQKIFISYGDHDMTDQIVHMVLARVPDAPPGTKGISCFVVPKFLVGEDGSLGDRNDVTVVGVEHKMGIHGSPTCTLAFGEQGEGAVGYLIGEANEGMKYMFMMMNDARLGVGIQGLAISQRAYQQAVQYAQDRGQGRAVDAAPGTQSPIIEHPDIRRSLMTMRAYIAAMRRLVYRNAEASDMGRCAADDAVRDRERKLGDLLTPLSKAWCTDLGVEITSMALQIHGGMGYVEETGMAQHFRDARIAPIYEGTNAIQALDLVGRKLPTDDGAFVQSVFDKIEVDLSDFDADLKGGLAEGLQLLRDATAAIAQVSDPNDALGAATPYLRIFATVVGGWLLCTGAHAVKNSDDAQDKALVESARFYVAQLLPQIHGLLPQVTAGATGLFELDEAQLHI